MVADNVKPWGEAIRSALAAEPDRWFSVVELVDRYASLIPLEDIRRRAEQRKRHGSSSTDHSAATTFIGGVIYTGIRQGNFERRRTAEGRLEVRATRALADVLAARTPGEIWPIRRSRMLAEAGLMTLAEAGAVIGVSYGQVLKFVKRGLLPAKKSAKVWAVSVEDAYTFRPPSRFADSLLETFAETELMTPTEAAAVIGVTREQVYGYLRRGLLPGTKFADRWGVPAEDVRNFKRPLSLRFGNPELTSSLADAGLMTATEAGAVIGVTRQSVPLYVQQGLLPGMKLANGLWVVPAGYVHGFKRPRRGCRSLSQQRAWDRILEGRVDPDDPHRCAYRGTVSRWAGDPDAVAALRRRDVVVGGADAAVVRGALLDPRPDAAHIYVAEESMNGGRSDSDLMRGLVADPLGEVVVRAVATDSWRRLRRCARPEDGVLYAPAAVAALDMLLSPHPEERQAAEEFLGA